MSENAWETLALLGVVVIVLGLMSNDSSRYVGLLLGGALILLAAAVTFLWRRDAL